MRRDAWGLLRCAQVPLFPGDSELQQLLHIFKLLGTPSEGAWEGVSKLRDWHEFPNWRKQARTLLLHGLFSRRHVPGKSASIAQPEWHMHRLTLAMRDDHMLPIFFCQLNLTTVLCCFLRSSTMTKASGCCASCYRTCRGTSPPWMLPASTSWSACSPTTLLSASPCAPSHGRGCTAC